MIGLAPLIPLIAGCAAGEGTVRGKIFWIGLYGAMWGISYLTPWIWWFIPVYMLGCYFYFFPSHKGR